MRNQLDDMLLYIRILNPEGTLLHLQESMIKNFEYSRANLNLPRDEYIKKKKSPPQNIRTVQNTSKTHRTF